MHRRAGFSLIELLVIIAVILILAALIVPSSMRAMERGRSAYCTGNLKQIGGALYQYLQDNEDRFTPKVLNGEHSVFAWLGKKGTGRYANMPARDRYLNPYLGMDQQGYDISEMKTAKCPSDPYVYDTTGSSYGSNHHPATRSLVESDDVTVITLSRVSQTDRFVVGAEHTANHQAWRPTAGGQEFDPLSEHWHFLEDRWNLLFADGHVASPDVERGKLVGKGYSYTFDGSTGFR